MIRESEIGGTIRRYRQERGLSLARLAALCGVTKGYLSKVENSPKAPPVSTLVNIARALGVSVSALLGEAEGTGAFSLVKRDERVTVARDATLFGYTYEGLVDHFPGRVMEPYVLTVPAGTSNTPWFQHEGEELLVVLEGALRFHHGDESYLVESGDSIYFDAGIRHRSFPVGDADVKCLVVIVTP